MNAKTITLPTMLYLKYLKMLDQVIQKKTAFVVEQIEGFDPDDQECMDQLAIGYIITVTPFMLSIVELARQSGEIDEEVVDFYEMELNSLVAEANQSKGEPDVGDTNQIDVHEQIDGLTSSSPGDINRTIDGVRDCIRPAANTKSNGGSAVDTGDSE
jgi:hypothetical protein